MKIVVLFPPKADQPLAENCCIAINNKTIQDVR